MIERTLNRVPALLLSLALLAPLAPALAQADRLADDVVTTIVLNDTQKRAIADFAAAHTPNLSAQEPQTVAKARAALVEPLGNARVSAATRLEMSRVLVDPVGRLVSDQREIVAINAVIIAGELATEPATQVLVAALNDQRPTVRYQSAYALGRTFESIRTSAPAIRADRALALIDALQARLAIETDGLVVDAIVRALIDAGRIDRQDFSQVPPAAVIALSKGMAASIKRQGNKVAEGGLIDAYIRAGLGLRDILAAQRLPDPAVRAAAELGADLIAHAVRVVEQKALPNQDPAVRSRYARVAAVGETVVLFVGTRLDPTLTFASRQIGDKLQQGTTGGDAAFAVDARGIVGSNGLVTKPPFSFPGNRFLER